MPNIYRLSNGIQVAMENIPHYRSVSMGIWVKAGSVNETDETNGMAHVIEHMLFKGTNRRSAKDIADAITEIGGNVDAFTTKEYTCFYAKTLQEHLEYAIDLLSDMITHSLITEDDLKKELGVIAEEIDMYDDSPDDIVHEQLQKKIWEGHPLCYLISGSKSIVTRFTRTQVLEFMNQFYTTNRIIISLSGRIDEAKTLSFLERSFVDAVQCELNHDMMNPHIPNAVYHPVLYTKHKDIEQIHLIMAFDSCRYDSDDRYVLTIVNNLLGGNVNSRLFQLIREELGLAYAIYSYGDAYEKGGLFHIYAAVHPDNVYEVISCIMNVIAELKEICIDERELHILKEQIKTELIIADESTYNRMNNCGKYLIHQENLVSTEEIVAAIDAVSAEEIQDYLIRYFHPENVSLSLVGDLSSLPEQEISSFLDDIRRRQA